MLPGISARTGLIAGVSGVNSVVVTAVNSGNFVGFSAGGAISGSTFGSVTPTSPQIAALGGRILVGFAQEFPNEFSDNLSIWLAGTGPVSGSTVNCTGGPYSIAGNPGVVDGSNRRVTFAVNTGSVLINPGAEVVSFT